MNLCNLFNKTVATYKYYEINIYLGIEKIYSKYKSSRDRMDYGEIISGGESIESLKFLSSLSHHSSFHFIAIMFSKQFSLNY